MVIPKVGPSSLVVYRFVLMDFLLGLTFVEGSSWKGKGNYHRPSEEEKKARDKNLFIYQYNQKGETSRRGNRSKPYPTLVRVRDRVHDHCAKNDLFRELRLGDVIMAGKERWRKLANSLDLDAFPKAMLHHGLQEIHHVNDEMDGRMDACLGYLAILTAEAFDSVGEVKVSIMDLQKRLAQEGWEKMCLKREFEDKLREAHLETADLKY